MLTRYNIKNNYLKLIFCIGATYILKKRGGLFMNLTQLNYLLVIEKKKNLTAAADELYISQPSLSQFLSKTETELGFSIFKRVKNQMFPTFAGQKYLECARHILSTYKETMTELTDYSENNYGELVIGLTIERSSLSLHKIYAQFHQNFPNIHLQCYENNPHELFKMTLSGEIDLFFSSSAQKSPDYFYQPLISTRLLLCINKHHPVLSNTDFLDENNHANLNLLSNFPCIMFRKGTQIRKTTDDLLQKAAIKSHILLETYSTQTICNFINEMNLYTFIFDMHIRPMENLLYFNISPEFYSTLCAITRKGQYINNAMQYFIDISKQIFIKELEENRCHIYNNQSD